MTPLVILPDSEPQPDLVLLTWRPDFYRHALPGPSDVALLIESPTRRCATTGA